MPGAIKDQSDVPFTNGFGDPVLGKAEVKSDGTITVELNEQGIEFMNNFRGFDFGGFDDDYEYEEDDDYDTGGW